MDEKNILTPQDEFFKNLNASILKNLDNTQYTIDNLCEDCFVSRSQLHRRIKEETSLSTSHYIRKVKLLKAKELLSDSNFTISEIAYASGFTSPQTLSRYFSAAFNESPSQFRSSRITEANKPIQEYTKREDVSEAERQSEVGYQESDVIDSINYIENQASLELPKKVNSEQDSDLYDFEFDHEIPKKSIGFIVKILSIPLFLFVLFWGYKQLSSNHDIKTEKLSQNENSAYLNSIAVLPFSNLGSPENEHFCAGIQEDILTKLTYFKDLKVISRTSSENYKNSDKPVKQIGAELGVRYILEGSVRWQDDKVAITAQLIRSKDDYHIWAENYVRKIDDVFKIQNEISLQIAKILNQKISAKTESQITNTYQPSKEAYTEFLIGKKLLQDRTHGSLLESIDRFEKALDKDSLYVDAIVSMANAYQLLGNIGYNRSQEYIAKSQKLSFEALKLDTDNAKAYAILACNYRDAHQWDRAKVTFEIALDRSPNDPLINYWYSLMLREIGEIEKAVIYSSKARELDPLYPVIHGGHIVNLAYADEVEKAQEAINEGDVLFKQSFMHHWAKAVFAESIFDYQAAIVAFEKVLDINPELYAAHSGILFSKARLGIHDETLAFIQEIKSNEGVDLMTKAMLYAGLEDSDQTIEFIMKAMEKGVFPTDILVDKNYDFLRTHEQYDNILNKYNLVAFHNTTDREN